MVYEVYKRISNGRDPKTNKDLYFATGTLVETSDWKNERSLIAQGYLGPPRKSQTEINKFLTKNKGLKAATTTEVVGVKRPAINTTKTKEAPLMEVPLEI